MASELELVPSSLDDVVVSYKATTDGGAQTFEPGDLRGFEVKPNGYRDRADPDDTGILDKGEYEVELKLRESDSDLAVKVTNRSDHRWREVRVYAVGVGKDGALARQADLETASFRYVGPAREFYLKPGETKDMTLAVYHTLGCFDVDYFEVLRVEADCEEGE